MDKMRSLSFVLLFLVALGFNVGLASAQTSYSVENLNTGVYYSTIQSAVNTVNGTGQTIEVYGNYTGNENVNIPSNITNLTIEAATNGITVKAASASQPVFSVAGNGTTIEGFTITGATSSDGIYLSNVSNCNVQNNNINNNSYGILTAGYNNTKMMATNPVFCNINNNNITDNSYGVYVNHTVVTPMSGNTITGNSNNGLTFEGSYDSIVQSNTINSNGANGVEFLNCVNGMAGYDMSNDSYLYMINCTCGCAWGNQLLNDNISSNGANGVYMTNSIGNFVMGSTLNDNGATGVNISNAPIGNNSMDSTPVNTIYNNTISNSGSYGAYLNNDYPTYMSLNTFLNNNNNNAGIPQAYAANLLGNSSYVGINNFNYNTWSNYDSLYGEGNPYTFDPDNTYGDNDPSQS